MKDLARRLLRISPQTLVLPVNRPGLGLWLLQRDRNPRLMDLDLPILPALLPVSRKTASVILRLEVLAEQVGNPDRTQLPSNRAPTMD